TVKQSTGTHARAPATLISQRHRADFPAPTTYSNLPSVTALRSSPTGRPSDVSKLRTSSPHSSIVSPPNGPPDERGRHQTLPDGCVISANQRAANRDPEVEAERHICDDKLEITFDGETFL